MIKRVALAIVREMEDQQLGSHSAWDDPEFRDNAMRCARAAIEAMREPTDDMLNAGNRLTLNSGTMSGCWSDHHPQPQEAWESMIEAALKDTTGE